jgi:hypothetical protein
MGQQAKDAVTKIRSTARIERERLTGEAQRVGPTGLYDMSLIRSIPANREELEYRS